MASKKELYIVRFKRVMEALAEAIVLRSTECDALARQYSQFIDSEVATSKISFSGCDAGSHRLDSFL